MSTPAYVHGFLFVLSAAAFFATIFVKDEKQAKCVAAGFGLFALATAALFT